MSYPSNDNQNIQPNSYPVWYKDGSILSLIITIISFFILMFISMLYGLLGSLLSLIIAILSKKYKSRIPIYSIIITAIAFVAEFIFVGIKFNEWYTAAFP
ncbi:MAG: hypothetical protein ACTSPA_06955 [Promethearchaeota archaeon]